MKILRIFYSNNLIVWLMLSLRITNRNMHKWKIKLLSIINTMKIQVLMGTISFSKNEKWKIKLVWLAGTKKANTVHLKEALKKYIKVYRNLVKNPWTKPQTTFISHHLDKVLRSMKYIREKWIAIIWIIRNTWELMELNKTLPISSKTRIWIQLRKKIVSINNKFNTINESIPNLNWTFE